MPVTPSAPKSADTLDCAELSQLSLMNWLWVRVAPAIQPLPVEPSHLEPPLGVCIRQELSWAQASCSAPEPGLGGSAAGAGAVRSEASSVPAQFCRSAGLNCFGLE